MSSIDLCQSQNQTCTEQPWRAGARRPVGFQQSSAGGWRPIDSPETV